MSRVMRRATQRRFTWSRAGVTICDALIAFGAVTALLPHHTESRPTPTAAPNAMTGGRVATVPVHELPAQVVAAQQKAAQQVAVRFATACDTTDPARPDGNVAIEAALAPGLVVPQVVEPAAWRTEDRATTVVLDPPGQPLAERGDTVTVIVTGTMTVTSDSGSPQIVPLAERIMLHPVNDDHSSGDHSTGDRGPSGWQVVGVEVGL